MKRIIYYILNVLGLTCYPLILIWQKIRFVMDFIYSQSVKYSFCKPIPFFVSFTTPVFFKNPRYLKIGNRVRISEYSTISAWDKIKTPRLIFGDMVRIGAFAHITCANEIIIGEGTLLGKFVTITDNAHGKNCLGELDLPPYKRELLSKGPVHIGKNVWIGDKVTVLPGVTIGDNAIIGSNSVVTKDIPANNIACGIPAKIIRVISE